MPKEKDRLAPTPSTVKKLFAYCGNQCAMPGCEETIVHESGTLLGKIAHICAAEKGGPRYDSKMTDEKRRHFDNLFIVCGKHHDLIDDKSNIKKYPVTLLRSYKKAHEKRFRRAERLLIEKFADTTQATTPTYPKNLRALATALDCEEIADHPDEIAGVCEFVDNLKELPLQQREFAIRLAERMRRNKVNELLVDDVTGAFGIGHTALKKHVRVLDSWGLASIDEGNEPGHYFVMLRSRKVDGNPWGEILDFCEATGRSPDEFVYDLNFKLYDE